MAGTLIYNIDNMYTLGKKKKGQAKKGTIFSGLLMVLKG